MKFGFGMAYVSNMADRDEDYVIAICDKVLGLRAERNHTFPFLLGDVGRNGRRKPLPVDAFYSDLKLVIEFHEHQHDDYLGPPRGRDTISGVKRSVQRRIYDQRRAVELHRNGITLVVLRYDLFQVSGKRLLKNIGDDETRVASALGQRFVLRHDPVDQAEQALKV